MEYKVEYYDDEKKNKMYEKWRVNDKLHWLNRPAHISYYWGNIKKREEWLIDGPAVIEYYGTGDLLCLQWYINGVRHRDNAPAYISYTEYDNLSYDIWYTHGKEIKTQFTDHNTGKITILNNVTRKNNQIPTEQKQYININIIDTQTLQILTLKLRIKES